MNRSRYSTAIDVLGHLSDVSVDDCCLLCKRADGSPYILRRSLAPSSDIHHYHPADLLKRHAERHDKREQSGLASQPKPGRMKGSTKKKPPVIHDSANDASAPQLSPTSELVAAFSAYDNLQRGGHTSASNSGGEYLESSAPNSAPDSVGSRATPLPSPPIIDDYDHNREPCTTSRAA